MHRKHIDKQPESSEIEPTKPQRPSSIVLVSEKDGNVCICVDNRCLNVTTLPEIILLQRTDECNDGLGEAKLFADLNSLREYLKIPIRDKYKKKTTDNFCPRF